jgi:hypothetical protein
MANTTSNFNYPLVKTLTEKLRGLKDDEQLWDHDMIHGEKTPTTEAIALAPILAKQLDLSLDMKPTFNSVRPELIERLIEEAEYLLDTLKDLYPDQPNTPALPAKQKNTREDYEMAWFYLEGIARMIEDNNFIEKAINMPGGQYIIYFTPAAKEGMRQLIRSADLKWPETILLPKENGIAIMTTPFLSDTCNFLDFIEHFLQHNLNKEKTIVPISGYLENKVEEIAK